MLDLYGWSWWHVPMPVVAERSGRGFRPYRKAAGLPDIFALYDHPPRMLILELKGDRGKLSDEQRKFLTLARAISEEHFELSKAIEPKRIGTYVVTPENLKAIEVILRTRVLT